MQERNHTLTKNVGFKKLFYDFFYDLKFIEFIIFCFFYDFFLRQKHYFLGKRKKKKNHIFFRQNSFRQNPFFHMALFLFCLIIVSLVCEPFRPDCDVTTLHFSPCSRQKLLATGVRTLRTRLTGRRCSRPPKRAAAVCLSVYMNSTCLICVGWTRACLSGLALQERCRIFFVFFS